MKEKKKKSGISLVVLIITILVISIIAGAVLLSMNQTNVLDNANKAVFKHNMAEYQTALNTYVARQIASGNYIEKEDIYAEGDEIKTIIPSIKQSDIDKIKIEGGGLVYVGTDENEISWARESQGVTVKPGGEDDPSEPETPTTKKKGKIEFAVKNYSKKVGDSPFTNPITKTGDGTVTYSSSNTSVATVTNLGEVTIIAEGTTTITATVVDGEQYEYETKTASYAIFVSANEKTISYSSSDYSGSYDTNEHSITLNVTDPASGYTVMYGTTEGIYNQETAPTLTNVGSQNVYFEITASGYLTVRGSSRVSITKAAGSISYITTIINKTYGDVAFTNPLTKTGDGTVTYESSDTTVATVDSSTGEVTIVKPGTTTITATVVDGTNYMYETTTASYTLTIAKANGSITLSENNGVLSYPNTATVEVTNPYSQTITVTSTDSTVAEGNVENNILTVTSKRKVGEATLTVTANANDYYTEATANYTANVTVDTTPLTCTITANKPDTTNAASIEYTFTFNKPVTGFTDGDITVTNGTAGLFTQESTSIYKLIVTNTGSMTQTVSIAAGVCQDVAENDNQAASKTITIDRTAPNISTLSVTSPTSGMYAGNQDVVITATYDEAVYNEEGVAIGTNSTSLANAPVLTIKVGSGSNKTVSASSSSGSTIIYTYQTTNGDNGTITFVSYSGNIYDSLGNERNVSKDSMSGYTINVDTTAPVISSLSVTTNTLTVNATDSGGSNLSKYAISTTNTQPDVNDFQTSNVFSVSQTTTYFAWAMDGAGNVSESATNTTSTVQTPTVTFTYDPANWTNGNVTVTAVATNPVSGMTLYIGESSNACNTLASTGITVTSNKAVYAVYKDSSEQFGGAATGNVEKIDRVAPSITTTTNSGAYNITIKGRDTSAGINAYYYSTSSTTPSLTAATSSTQAINKWVTFTASTLEISKTLTGFTEAGTYYYWFKDQAGNISLGGTFTMTKVPASSLQYSPETSGWNSGDVQDAIDKLYELFD